MKKLFLLMMMAAAVVACTPPNEDNKPNKPDDGGNDTVPVIPEPEISRFLGGDISLLPSYEAAQTPYIGRDGQKIADLITYLHDTCLWNSARVRLCVDPVTTNADGSKHGEVQVLT